MPKYNTHQRTALLDFLEKNSDRGLTAGEIAGEFEGKISKSAIYRNLSALYDEGRVRKYTAAGEKEFRYQLEEKKSEGTLHLSCKKCGRIYSANDEGAERLLEFLAKNEDFSLDCENTLLSGICKKCK